MAPGLHVQAILDSNSSSVWHFASLSHSKGLLSSFVSDSPKPPAGPPKVNKTDEDGGPLAPYMRKNTSKDVETQAKEEFGPGEHEAFHPPRHSLRVADYQRRPHEPPPPPPDPKSVEKEIKALEPQHNRAPKVDEPDGPVNVTRRRPKQKPPPKFEMISWNQFPAHGTCDPAAMFQMRSLLREIKRDVPDHVCADRYKEADNGLIDLQLNFNRGMAKCQNRYWQQIAFDKVVYFERCIRDEIAGAMHMRPAARNDLVAKISEAEHAQKGIFVMSSNSRPPAPMRRPPHNQRPPHPLTPEQAQEVQQIEEDIVKQDKEAAENPEGVDPIPNMTVKSKLADLPKAPEREVVHPPPGDSAYTAWTEPGAPPSAVVHAGMPLSGICLMSSSTPSRRRARRNRIAESFLCATRGL